MSYLNIVNSKNTNTNVILELNQNDIIQEINNRDNLNEFSNKKNTTTFLGTTQNYYVYLGYTVLDLLRQGFKKKDFRNANYSISQLISGNFNSVNFIQAGYSIQDLIDAGYKNLLRKLGYSILDLYTYGFQKSDFDNAGYSVYDLLDILTNDQVINLGYSQHVVNAYRTFIFQIPTTSWDASNNIPHKYPINNILHSFQDLSINQIRDSSGITTVTITWKKDVSGNGFDDTIFINAELEDTYFDQSNNGFIDSSTNDGFSLNPYNIPYHNDPNFIIKQFGGIPFSRNSAINSNFFQGYQFGGKIQAFDTPRFLKNTCFYNAFINTTGSSSNSNTASYILPGAFQNISSWPTYNITDFRNTFKNAKYFHERIGNWNFFQIRGKYLENIISGAGYNPIQASIFLQDLSNNMSLQSDISLGTIPNYYINSKTRAAIQNLSQKNIKFQSTGIIPNISDFRTNYASFGYTSFTALLTDTKIAGFQVRDLSSLLIPITNLKYFKFAGYTITEINAVKRYTISDYITNNFTLSDFISSGYTALDLSKNSTILGFGPTDYHNISYIRQDLKQIFTIDQLLSGGYTLKEIIILGYSLNIIINDPIISQSNYSILDFTAANISLLDISNASIFNNNLSLSNLSNYDSSGAYLLKQNNITVNSLRNIGYTIPQILGLNYSLADLHDASYSIIQIQQYKVYSDLSYTAAGYSLTDISSAGFPLSHLLTYSTVPPYFPTILKQNNIRATDFAKIGYDCLSLAQIYLYGINDLLNAGFSLSTINITNKFQIIDFSNAGITVQQLKTIGYTALQVSGNIQSPIYSLSQLITAGYTVKNLKDASYSIVDLSNANPSYKILDYYLGGYSLQNLVNVGYTFAVLYTNLQNIYYLQYKKNIIQDLIPLYSSSALINFGFTLSDLYIRYNIPLNILQTVGYSSIEVATLNSYIQYYNNMNKNTDISFVTIQNLHDASFNATQLIGKNITTRTDLYNVLANLNKYYTNSYNISGTIDNFFNTVIKSNSAILPYDDFLLVNTTPPFQYNFNSFKPFGTTSLLGPGTDPNFDLLSYYQPLNYTAFSFLYPGVNLPGTVYLLDKIFYYTDVSSGLKITYNQIQVYNNGWLTLGTYNYDNSNVAIPSYTPTLGIRFFQFPIQASTIVYAFWKTNTSNHNIVEVIFNGTDINGQLFQITINIYDYGLITLCNGDGETNIYNPNTLRYSNPDPLLVQIGSKIKYYHPPMKYTYDLSSNIVISQMYDILSIDLRYGIQDPSSGIYLQKGVQQLGYLAGELQGVYSQSELKSAGFSALNLRNIGYTAHQLYDLSFSPFDIVTAYNINFDISGILNYK